MKKILILASALVFIAGMSTFAQNDKGKAPQKKTNDKVQTTPANAATPVKGTPPQPQVTRPKLSKEDSLKRQHKIDSIRKVIADKRAKGELPKLSKEDSIKRAHKIDSLKKVARERNQTNQAGPQPYKPRMSKQDSLKKVQKMDSLRKAAAARQGKQPVPTTVPAKKEEKK